MTLSVESAQIALGPRQILVVHDGRGTRLSCTSGAIWITQEDDGRDVVLEGGGSFVLDRAGMALVTAMARSHLRVG